MTKRRIESSIKAKNTKHMYTYAWPVENKEINYNQGLCFVELDLSGVVEIRDYLEAVCTKFKFSEKQILSQNMMF